VFTKPGESGMSECLGTWEFCRDSISIQEMKQEIMKLQPGAGNVFLFFVHTFLDEIDEPALVSFY
jgi:hypothetical protein